MKKLILALVALSTISSAFAHNHGFKRCRAEAMAVAHEEYRQLISQSDFAPIIRVFSSRENGNNIIHFVTVSIDGSRDMITVELNANSCKVVRVD